MKFGGVSGGEGFYFAGDSVGFGPAGVFGVEGLEMGWLAGGMVVERGGALPMTTW